VSSPLELTPFLAPLRAGHRPQYLSRHLLDIRALIEANPNLDQTRIKHWVADSARALDMPELWNDIADWLPDA
jgi:hypothetical protein